MYKIPSVIRKGNAPVLGFRNPEDTLTDKYPVKEGPSERLFIVDKKQFSESQKRNFLLVAMFMSLIPIFYLFINSQEMLRKMEVKSITRKRRERLDKEHGIDREAFFENMEKLDKAYRISEKEEIQKMRQLGKSPRKVTCFDLL